MSEPVSEPVGDQHLLEDIETYYDTVPRAAATTEEVGPFTLFVKTDPQGWPYYARPRLGLAEELTPYDVEAVRARQRELGVPQALEWMHEHNPSLLDAVRSDKLDSPPLAVRVCPLLVLPAASVEGLAVETVETRVLAAESPDLAQVAGAVSAGFHERDDVVAKDASGLADLIARGLSVVAGAFDATGAIGGGSHSPRGTTTELAGIAVLPRARRRGVGAAITHALAEDARRRGIETIFLSAQDDTVARVYERVGFVRVGTACIAELSET